MHGRTKMAVSLNMVVVGDEETVHDMIGYPLLNRKDSSNPVTSVIEGETLIELYILGTVCKYIV